MQPSGCEESSGGAPGVTHPTGSLIRSEDGEVSAPWTRTSVEVTV